MELKASAKHIRMSPRKVRLVADLVRSLEVGKALDQLRFINKWAARPIAKLINSALANAEHNFDLDKNNLYIKKITVDEGTTLHRWMPRAFGRATPIRKRNSHIAIVLAEIKDSGPRKAKKLKTDKPFKLAGQPKQDEGIKVGEKGEGKKDKIKAPEQKEKTGEIIDPRREAQGGHSKIEGGGRGFTGKVFRRKSG